MFLTQWRDLGGPAARLDGFLDGQLSRNMACLVRHCDNGGWHLDHIGMRHEEVNGFPVEGYMENFLPPQQVLERRDVNMRTAHGAGPVLLEEVGTIGDSRETWTNHMLVPIAPPSGASEAVMGISEWHSTCPHLELECLIDVVRRYCPPEDVRVFRSPTPRTLQYRLGILSDILSGEHGEVSPPDLALVSIVVMNLKVETPVRDIYCT